MTTDSTHIVFEQIHFAAVTHNGFSDVCILTEGEAQGHGVLVDGKTIDGFMAGSLGKTIPAYLTHQGAIDDTGRPADRLGKEIGMFSGFYRDGNKVRARNFQFLESFIQAEPKTHATLVEMAQKFADKLGISPVVAHLRAWVMGDGTEVTAKDGKRPLGAMLSLPSMRIGSIKSCDFVQQPAANLGLFEARVDDNTNNMATETVLLSVHTSALAVKDGEIATLSQQHKDAIAALEAKHRTDEAILQAKANDAVALAAKLTESEKNMSAALAAKAKEADEAAKYDMRKAGAPALEIALQAHQAKIPEPAASDAARWEQYAALCTSKKDDHGNVVAHLDTPASTAFKAKYLTRK